MARDLVEDHRVQHEAVQRQRPGVVGDQQRRAGERDVLDPAHLDPEPVPDQRPHGRQEDLLGELRIEAELVDRVLPVIRERAKPTASSIVVCQSTPRLWASENRPFSGSAAKLPDPIDRDVAESAEQLAEHLADLGEHGTEIERRRHLNPTASRTSRTTRTSPAAVSPRARPHRVLGLDRRRADRGRAVAVERYRGRPAGRIGPVAPRLRSPGLPFAARLCGPAGAEPPSRGAALRGRLLGAATGASTGSARTRRPERRADRLAGPSLRPDQASAPSLCQPRARACRRAGLGQNPARSRRAADGVRPPASPRAARDGALRLPRPASPRLPSWMISASATVGSRRPRPARSAPLDLVQRRRHPAGVQQPGRETPTNSCSACRLVYFGGKPIPSISRRSPRRIGRWPSPGRTSARPPCRRRSRPAGPAGSARRRSAPRTGARRCSAGPSSGSPGSSVIDVRCRHVERPGQLLAGRPEQRRRRRRSDAGTAAARRSPSPAARPASTGSG